MYCLGSKLFCTKTEAYYSALQITRYLKPPTELRHNTSPIAHKKKTFHLSER
jgi:hypothetical protein